MGLAAHVQTRPRTPKGADAICQRLAQYATPPLPGSYEARLSIDNTPNQSPANGRFRRSGKPYHLVDGTQIAANWTEHRTSYGMPTVLALISPAPSGWGSEHPAPARITLPGFDDG